MTSLDGGDLTDGRMPAWTFVTCQVRSVRAFFFKQLAQHAEWLTFEKVHPTPSFVGSHVTRIQSQIPQSGDGNSEWTKITHMYKLWD